MKSPRGTEDERRENRSIEHAQFQALTRSGTHARLARRGPSLRQYASVVSVNSTDSSTLGVDVRRFPWIRRLAADYAFDFPRSRRFFPAIRPIPRPGLKRSARTQAHGRRRAEIAAVIADQQRRRAAPPRRGGRRRDARRSADRRHRHRPAGGAVRRAAVHAAQGADGAQARRARSRASHRCRASPSSGSTPRITTGTKSAPVTVFDESLAPRDRRAAGPRAGRATRRSRRSVSTSRSSRRSTSSTQRCPPTEFTASLLDEPARTYAPGARHGRRVRPLARARARRARPRRLRRVGSGGQAAGLRRVRARAVDAGRDGAAGRGSGRGSGGARLPRAGRAAGRQPGAVSPRRRPPARSGSRTASSSSANRRSTRPTLVPKARRPSRRPSARTCCCGRSCRTRCFRRSVTSPGPNELAYLGQLRGVYEHFGVPMPLMYPRASATLLDSAALRFLTQVRGAARSAAGAGRSGAERAAQAQIPASVEASFATRPATASRRR